MTDVSKNDASPEQEKLSRRRALTRLGLTVGVTAYVAPVLTRLNEAEAQSGGCPPGYHKNMGACVFG